MGDAAYGTADELLFRSNANQDVMTLTSAGHVGIGTVDPQAYLEIVGDEPGGTVDLRLYNTGGSNSRILFKEYASLDDFAIEYNGNVGGWNNWLEFWGRNPSQHGDRPIMTMQRDYNPDENNYNGIGIGVPGSTHIDATLRVQNYGDEDVFQVYADDAEVLSVTDAGELCLNGVCSTSLFSSPAPLTYNVGAYVTTHMGEATAGCYSGFALTDWSCSGSHLNKCSQNAMQGIVGSIGGDASATGVCTRFDPAPPVDPPDTYAVSCSANGWDTCTVGCPAGSYALTDWSCSGSPSACSQGADTGSATCNGSACSGAGTCTEI